MLYVGINLHKHTISVCVGNQGREVVRRKQLPRSDTRRIAAFLEEFRPFRAVVEATSS